MLSKMPNFLKKKKKKKYSGLITNTEETKLLKDINLIKIENISEPNTKLLDYISLAKIIASYSVVILHTNGAFWYFNYKTYKEFWISANIIESTFYFAVPFFALCIGVTLLDFNEKYGIIKYYYKRIIKVVIPLILWTYIVYFYKVYYIKNMKKVKLTFENLWNMYYQHRVIGIYQSFHSFIKLYMIIPFLAYIEKSNKIKIYTYGLILLLLFQTIFPYLIALFHLNLRWIYNIQYTYSHYLFAGYLIHNKKFSRAKRFILYILGISSLFLTIFATKYLTLKYKKIITLHKGYLNLPCILYSCALFLFIKENTYILLKYINKKYINYIGSLTIGPFFMHYPVIDFYSKNYSVNKYRLKYRLFDGSIIYIICLILTAFLKKIPILKYLVP